MNNLTGSDKFNYIFNFENLNESIYKEFVSFCLVNLDNNVFCDGLYAIPLWLIFTISISCNRDESKRRKVSIEERENEIFVDVKYIDEMFFNSGVKRHALQTKVREIMDYYIKTIDKRVANDSA
jgi:hypothetical protein